MTPNKIEIINFSDDLKDAIKILNYEWLEKYFRVEESDIRSLCNPREEIIEKGGFIFYAKNFCKRKREANFNGGADMRVRITLACTECKQRNYDTMKNKKNTPDRVEMNKYCRFCKKHTLHRETK